MNKSWVKIVIGLLVAVNLALLAKIYVDRSNAKRNLYDVSSYLGQDRLPNVLVTDRNGKGYYLPELTKSDKPTMVVFFTPSDCPNCLDEKIIWEELINEYDINVVAVSSSPDKQEFWQWESFTKIPVPLYLDTTYAAVDSMYLETTPLKVLFNKNNTAVWADPPRLDEHTQKEFYKDLEYAIKTYL